MFKKRIRADFSKYLLFAMLSNSIKASCIWFCGGKSAMLETSSDLGMVAYAVAVFDQDVIVTADGDQKEYHLHVIENVNPLLSL